MTRRFEQKIAFVERATKRQDPDILAKSRGDLFSSNRLNTGRLDGPCAVQECHGGGPRLNRSGKSSVTFSPAGSFTISLHRHIFMSARGALICSNVHCRGALSGRHRISFVPWRKRWPLTWSNRTSTTSSGRSGSHSPLRSVLHRLGPPGALPVKPCGLRKPSSFRVKLARSTSMIVEVKPTWSSLPSSS